MIKSAEIRIECPYCFRVTKQHTGEILVDSCFECKRVFLATHGMAQAYEMGYQDRIKEELKKARGE